VACGLLWSLPVVLVCLSCLAFVLAGVVLLLPLVRSGLTLLALCLLLPLSLLLLLPLAWLLRGVFLCLRSRFGCPASFWGWGSRFFFFVNQPRSLPMPVSNPAAKEMYLARRAELHSRIEELLVLQSELQQNKYELVKLNDILDIEEDPFVDMEDHYNN
jgi:hypothetical protein